jgi:AP-1 complex subunit gamma-1
VDILARFQVTGSIAAAGINFQVAVPKTQQLQMQPMSNPDVNPGATETQQMRVTAPVGSNVRLRLRISFSTGGRSIQDQVDFSGFPPGLTG